MDASKHLVLLGAGHAHVEVLRDFARAPVPGLRITVMSRERLSPYSGMLPGVIGGRYAPGEALVDAPALAAKAGAIFLHDEATAIDPSQRQVRGASGGALTYDLLSIDIGATPRIDAEGAEGRVLPIKPIDALLARFEAIASARSVAVVGGGPAGFEIALGLRARQPGAGVTLAAGLPGLLPALPEGVRRRAAAALARHDVSLSEGHEVTHVQDGVLQFDGRPPIAADALLWCTGAAAPAILAASGLPCDAEGFLRVQAGLNVPGHPEIFAAGDAASFLPRALPKAGLYAVRQGPVLAANLRRAAAGAPPLPFRPQRHALVLLSTGDGRAIGTRNGFVAEGRWVWRWKDRIDRAFMRRYSVT
ncbi:FAD-dependent oxidoreductase [Plastoroseomonas arctica]|uniref:FAD-dependent oxidoreductase n=1 Tax=Plastoroseomonas arctica TaxID=1509237 RepID=A0AAF1K2W4_9PROT|nr:FAD-dependent oxidoreductase [Plastoroseomonas arctica]MBR0655299.1 FAD-dependent oxidoreductase [Plastoroseomonas arctica]